MSITPWVALLALGLFGAWVFQATDVVDVFRVGLDVVLESVLP